MKLGWYLNRLRSMEPAEVLHRLAEAAKKRASKGRHEGWARYPAGGGITPLPGLRNRILAAGPEHRAAIANAAERTLSGHFSALGRDWPKRDPATPFPPDLWRLDPVTGGSWPGPETYALDIDFRHDGRLGDVKYVWEINRLQFIVALAAQAARADDRRSAEAIEAAVASWHAANPPFRGVGWASGIEVALRAISLLVAVSLAGDRLGPACHRQIGEILAASAFWLPRFPSKFSSANNHLVAELAGEYLIAHALGHPTTGARDALTVEIGRQILPDGTPAEQTPTYGAFTAELALLCAAVGQQAGQPFPPAALDRLAAFATFIATLGAPTPGYGDDDEGRAVTLGGEADYAASVASAIAALSRQPGPLPAPGDFRELIFGRPASSRQVPGGLVTYPDGGVSVWRGNIGPRTALLRLDHGPLGYLSIAAHGHADALSLTLSVDGEPVLVDPGTYLYGSGGAWRSWFRSTPAHNTLNIDGASQSVMSGAFNWSSKAQAQLAETGRDPRPWLRLQHDGYRQRFGRLHQRTVEIEAGRIAVTDQLIGGPPLAAEIVFQLAPGLAADIAGTAITIRRGADPLLRIDFPAAGAVIARTGEDAPDGGWVSPRFGTKLPATRLGWSGPVGEGAVTTWLTPLGAAPLDTHSHQT